MTPQDNRARLDAVFAKAPVIPVITIEDASHAVPLAQALVKGGLPVIEITLRTQAGLDAARAIVAEVPDALVGIGTVLTPADYQRAAEIRAAFAISPGMSIELLDAAKAGALPYAPGVQTASELMACVTRGFDVVKLFPAVPAGGLATLDSLAGPFPTVRFCPTGGVNLGNAGQWLAHKKVVAIGGSWIAPAADIKAGRWDVIEQRAREAAALRPV